MLRHMIHALQSLIAPHPQGNPHGVASINWQKQHYRNNALGTHVKTLSESIVGAQLAGKPFTIELSGANTANRQMGSYHLSPFWDETKRELKLEISNDPTPPPDNTIIATIGLSPLLVKSQLLTLQKPDVSDNERKVAHQTGSHLLRDYMMNHNITPSESLARALFDTLHQMHTEQHKARERH